MMLERLLNASQQMGVELSSWQAEACLSHLNLLQKWNRVYNLTAIQDWDDMLVKHTLDSLAIAPYLEGNRFVDIGTGGGFPGMVLAIAQPERHFTLVDRTQKKTVFLRQVMIELGLTNVAVIHARAEQLHPNELFNGVLSRAFSSLKDMIEITQHLLAAGGYFYAMKSAQIDAELSQLPPHVERVREINLAVPDLGAERRLVILKKKL
ncbi:MAG: 16S rRNA (guanine(527)-N(7))-methyltransferase RsmG [Gammaproteobacteria bacterium]|nr:16S rRNA (guanine(527)-N(7))-methyltransferase RsmG [Gammaproteobacteria bacterium]